MAHFVKGIDIHVRDYRGMVDTRRKYRIRSCGKKQAIVDSLRLSENGDWTVSSYRGATYYLDSPQRIRRAEEAGQDTSRMKRGWNDVFVLCGQDGWDPSEN